ncbi:MAG: nucleotidyltransferase domain-containing protein [Planctomycetota bacterium]
MAATPSGRFVLRTPPALHRALRRAARQAGLSLNAYCVRRLAAPAAERTSGAPAVVAWAGNEFGDALCGVLVYGSWARGEATTESDVDVLVVLDASVALTRDIYRRCDLASLSWDGHPVQVQIVRMPDADGVAGGGLWPEMALDGIVMFERDFSLSRRLVAVRRAIADGRLVRRTAHGQPYWTTREAA